MNLYNLLFGRNQFSTILLKMLNTTEDAIPRYRDCYLDEKGRIIIHTRTGGGNRAFYDSLESCKDHYPEYFNGNENDPSGPWNADLRKLSGYLYDKDDDFDSTYANFVYRPRDEFKPIIDGLLAFNATTSPKDKWQKLFSDLENAAKTPEVELALEVGKLMLAELEKEISK